MGGPHSTRRRAFLEVGPFDATGAALGRSHARAAQEGVGQIEIVAGDHAILSAQHGLCALRLDPGWRSRRGEAAFLFGTEGHGLFAALAEQIGQFWIEAVAAIVTAIAPHEAGADEDLGGGIGHTHRVLCASVPCSFAWRASAGLRPGSTCPSSSSAPRGF